MKVLTKTIGDFIAVISDNDSLFSRHLNYSVVITILANRMPLPFNTFGEAWDTALWLYQCAEYVALLGDLQDG